jgi:hypothetical protein
VKIKNDNQGQLKNNVTNGETDKRSKGEKKVEKHELKKTEKAVIPIMDLNESVAEETTSKKIEEKQIKEKMIKHLTEYRQHIENMDKSVLTTRTNYSDRQTVVENNLEIEQDEIISQLNIK